MYTPLAAVSYNAVPTRAHWDFRLYNTNTHLCQGSVIKGKKTVTIYSILLNVPFRSLVDHLATSRSWLINPFIPSAYCGGRGTAPCYHGFKPSMSAGVCLCEPTELYNILVQVCLFFTSVSCFTTCIPCTSIQLDLHLCWMIHISFCLVSISLFFN